MDFEQIDHSLLPSVLLCICTYKKRNIPMGYNYIQSRFRRESVLIVKVCTD